VVVVGGPARLGQDPLRTEDVRQVGRAVAEFLELADQTRMLGPDAPDTLTTRNGLAYWLGRRIRA
jgi:hypothetical protein